MTTPRAAVRYRCPCGTEYLVAIPDTGDPSWFENVRTAAGQLRLGFVDGREPAFVCTSCGRTHAHGAHPTER
jgi:hypothetical protein